MSYKATINIFFGSTDNISRTDYSFLRHFLLGRKPQILVYHLLILVILFIAISLSAKHYGERFVANVLAETSIK